MLNQLKLDPDDMSTSGSSKGDNDSGIQESTNAVHNNSTSEAGKKESKLKKFGFGTKRGRSAGHLKVSYETPAVQASEEHHAGMKRIETIDVSLFQEQSQPHKSGWLSSARRVSEAFLAKLPRSSSYNGESGVKKQPDNNKNNSEEIVSFSIDKNQPRFTRSRITSQWEDLHSLPE